MTFISNLINGISLGSVYAIIALGYTMVYGIAKMLNFAHGDVIMVGAYICFCMMTYLGMPPIVAVIAAMVVCTLLGILIEGLAYKPLRKASSLALLITAIGVSYFLHNMGQRTEGIQHGNSARFDFAFWRRTDNNRRNNFDGCGMYRNNARAYRLYQKIANGQGDARGFGR